MFGAAKNFAAQERRPNSWSEFLISRNESLIRNFAAEQIRHHSVRLVLNTIERTMESIVFSGGRLLIGVRIN